ncbi:unnamed protein product [Phytophthora fragariaefolia]|uniref:Unnamed protein product n=1 Tax=Phytophthora fragariaefolia TaxID=1490495 RepID=A0A9W6Y229_9STRA|nr:unnamed protein product [Phytophthora fragariaefolia]
MDEADNDDNFDNEQFLLAEQVRNGLYYDDVKCVVTEREAVLREIAKQHDEDALADIEEYRKAREAKQDKPGVEIKSTVLAAKVSTCRRQHSRIFSTELVGKRVSTPPPLEHDAEGLEDNSDWVKVEKGKWQTRTQLQKTGEKTMVESFQPDQVTAWELLNSEGKWQVFLHRQMPNAQLEIEDLELG